MRFTIPMLGLIGCALLAAGCSRQAATNNTVANATGIVNDMATPMNDASAMESAANVSTMPPPPSNLTNSADVQPLGDTTGGDTGGNTVQSNVAGM